MVKIDLSQIQAAIFDMDGTMVDNMGFHQQAWKEFLKRKGVQLSDEDFREKISGKKNSEIFKIVFQKVLTPREVNMYAEEKEKLYREIYSNKVIEIEGLSNVITELENKNIKLAVATSAPKANRDFVLSALNLSEKFPVIIGEEDILHGKPNPEIYLKTAAKLGVPAAACLVFEDSPAGVRAAKEAGMHVVGLLIYHSAEELGAPEYTVGNFTQIEFS